MSVMKKFIVLLVPVFVAVLGVEHAAAGAFDFTNVPGGGALGTASVSDGGVTATGYNSVGGGAFSTANLTLWLREETGDNGLGICTGVETIAACTPNLPGSQGGEYNELSNELSLELLQLDRGASTNAWTELWLSSLDNNGGNGLPLEVGTVGWSNDGNPTDGLSLIGTYTFDNTIFLGAVEGNLFTQAGMAGAASARYLYFIAGTGAVGGNNDYLVWRGATADPVPEPATLLLLGSGLAGVAARVRRRKA